MGDVEIEPLIQRQLRRWAIEQRAGMPGPRGPCVAVSRLPGSGGREIAVRVAEWLDYGLFDRPILESLAAAGARELLEEGLDAEVRSGVSEEVARAMSAGSAASDPALGALFALIGTLGQRGMSVLLGRGAAALLPAARALRVLVVAPAEVRAARLAESGLDASAAGARIRDEDEARARFLRVSLGVELDDPTVYDLVVNTEQLSPDAAAALVVDALRRRFPVG